MSTAEDKAAQRKAERERRQARVRASGGDRLAKITGAAGSKDFKPPPVTEQPQQQVQPQRSAIASTETNPMEGGGTLLDFLKQSDSDGSNGDSDPLMAMLAAAASGQQFNGQDGNQQYTPQQQQQQQQNMAAAQNRSRQKAKTDFWWDVVHFLLSIALGMYAALGNPWYICRAFTTVQVAVLAAQILLGHRSSGLEGVAMLAPFINMLPKNRRQQINIAGAVISAARSAYKDFAIIIFVYGMASVGGRNFVRL